MAPTTARLQPELTDGQAQAWAAKVDLQARIDPLHRGPRWWGLFLGLFGANLDRVLVGLGEPPAPRGLPPVMKPRRAFYVKRLLAPFALLLALVGSASAQDPAPAPSPKPPCDPAAGVCLGVEGWLMTCHTWAPGAEAKSLVGGRLQAEARWHRWRWAVRGDATGVPGEYEPGKLETVRAAEVHVASAYDALRLPGLATLGPAVAVGAAVALERNDAGTTAHLPNALTAGLGLRASWPGGWGYVVGGLNQAFRGFAVTGTWQIAVSDRVASIGTVAVAAGGVWTATTGVGVRWK